MKNYIISLLLCASLSAATWHVDDDGNDSNSGVDAGNAVATISNAVCNLAGDGDTILLHAGTYTEVAVADYYTKGITAWPGVWPDGLTLQGAPGETAIWRPASQPTFQGAVIGLGADSPTWGYKSLSIRDFEIDGTNCLGTQTSLVQIRKGYDFVASNMVFRNMNYHNAIGIQQNVCTNASVVDCSFYNWAHNDGEGSQPHALYLQKANNATIERNYFEGTNVVAGFVANKSCAIHVYVGSRTSNNLLGVVLRRNRIVSNAAGMALFYANDIVVENNEIYTTATTIPAVYSAGSAGLDFWHNTVYGGSKSFDVADYSQSTDYFIANNILSGAAHALFVWNTVGEVVTASNNVATGIMNGAPNALAVIGGTVASDPDFVDAPDDFDINSTSPARNAGLTISAVTTDIDGTARPQESFYDIGAYEYSSGGTLPVISVDSESSDLYCYEDVAGSPVAGTIWLTRSLDGTNGSTTVNLVWSGTATGEGTHYTQSATNSIDMAAGTVSTNLTVTPVDVAGYQGPLTIILTVDTGSYTVGAVSAHTMTRVDGDAPSVYIK